MERKYVLDIGIGRGGSYINYDKQNGLQRVGLDRRDHNLIFTTRNYGIYGCQATATPEKGCMPFADNSFCHIDVLFPHHGLFINLTKQESALWLDLRRVLACEGSLRIVFDTECDKRMTNPKKAIYHPEFLIEQAAIIHEFTTQTRALNEEEIIAINTIFANRAIDRSRQRGDVKIFEILCIK